jgi:transcription initiation factor IIE alpha subunit
VQAESKIALDCPYCGESIYQAVAWFKNSYSTCPACDKGLSANQFDAAINALEQAFDQNIEALLAEEPPQGGCCGSKKTDSCCGKH